MRRPAVVAVSAIASALGLGLAPQQAPRTFRAATEAVVIDASVLDRNRQPVRGLTAADFTILEDGQPQEIRTFREIDLGAEGRPPEPAWSPDHPPDVRRNDEFRDHAVVVIVLDDSTPSMSSGDVLHAKEVGGQIIDRLRPGDLAAVVHTKDKSAGQDFTKDRTLLRAAVKRIGAPLARADSNAPTRFGSGANWMPQPAGGVPPELEVMCLVTLSALKGIARTLSALPEQRKVLIFISAGMPIDPGLIVPQGMGDNGVERATQDTLSRELLEFIGEANRSNISVYAIDPGGLRASPNSHALNFLRAVSLDTGGVPVVNTNDPTKPIEQIYKENQHYYLLGYQASNPRTEGRFRTIEVRVNRPDATVRTRNGYYEPRKTSASPATDAPAVVAALQGALPVGDLPLQMTAACFSGRSGKRADVAIAVEASEVGPPGHVATTSDVEVEAHAYDTNWRLQASHHFTFRLAIPADSGQPIHYALLPRLELAPGRYQLRVAVGSSLTGRRGSVYYDVTVPDFSKAPLAASGIVLDVRPRTASAPAGAFAPLLPFDPTARREFTAGDQVTAMLKVYQRGRKEVLPVRVTARLLDSEGQAAWSAEQALGREQFSASSEAEYRVELPVSTLARGQYLLEIEASDGRAAARSDLRFRYR